jgi:hypothetical protein
MTNRPTFLLIPWKAFATLLSSFFGGLLISFVGGSWLLPTLVALGVDGWNGLRHLRTQELVFGAAPKIGGLDSRLMELAQLIVMTTVGLWGTMASLRTWRRFVVGKKWMTEKEVEDLNRRGGGG